MKWIPDHQKVYGNELLHNAAPEALSQIHEKWPGVASEAKQEQHYDYEEALQLAKKERREALRLLIPEEEDPIPPVYSRWVAVRLRRIRTGASVCPAKRAHLENKPEERRRTGVPQKCMRLQLPTSATCQPPTSRKTLAVRCSSRSQEDHFFFHLHWNKVSHCITTLLQYALFAVCFFSESKYTEPYGLQVSACVAHIR